MIQGIKPRLGESRPVLASKMRNRSWSFVRNQTFSSERRRIPSRSEIRTRNQLRRRGCPRIGFVLQKSIDDVLHGYFRFRPGISCADPNNEHGCHVWMNRRWTASCGGEIAISSSTEHALPSSIDAKEAFGDEPQQRVHLGRRNE